MKFTEVTVHTTTEGSELVADILWRYSNYGVAISDVKDVIALQRDKVMYWDYMDEDLTKDTGSSLRCAAARRRLRTRPPPCLQ